MFNEQKILQRRPAISVATIAPYFSFRRIKIINQQVLADASESRIWAQPSKQDKAVYKGSKYLLLKNKNNLKDQTQRQQLKQLLALNETINTMMILGETLKRIWTYHYRRWATKTLDHWCSLARSLNHPSVNAFAKMLDRYRYGILNHCQYPIHTDKLEGVNNKIRAIKRKAYGFQDLR